MESLSEISDENTVENMESEDTGEVQYVYDESQMILGAPDDFSNITDLILEDGTRAMIVNGTLVTADGQTLILQDGSDLSQYYVDENTDEILLSQEEEEQFLGIVSLQDSQTEEQVVKYIQDDSTTSPNQEEFFYIQDDDQIIPVQEQYQLTNDASENGGVPMPMVKLGNQQIIEEMNGVIDLEQFLNQQGLVHLEGGNYQYAVLKDGKFHIQNMNDSTSGDILKHQNKSNVNEASLESSADLSYVDLSAIRGKDMNTGEQITLSKYMNKVYSKNKKKEIDHKSKIKAKDKFEVLKSPAISNGGLRSLINKKIPIGKTDKGKLLVGRIINVTKKTEGTTHCFQSNNVGSKRNSIFKKRSVVPPRGNKKNLLSNVRLTDEVIDLVDDKEIEISKPTDGKKLQNSNFSARASDSKVLPDPSIESNLKKDKDKTSAIPSTTELSESLALQNTNEETVKRGCTSPNPTEDKSVSTVETSKIVVHNKIVTKDCFEVIARTLTGLMNMESVVKKLRNKTIIIKIIEKSYDLDKGEYSKSVSYCTGYMVREYQVNEEADNFSESWRFIPDTNSRDTILVEDNLQTEALSELSNLKRVANLTIQITINPQGCRTTRVIINPPNMYKCKDCTKSFRTSSALKVHTSDYHTPASLECSTCSIKFKNCEESKEHFSIHPAIDNKGMYECMECNKRFGSSLMLRRHMDIHFKPVNCQHCNQIFSNMRDLKKHLPVHEPTVSQPPPVPMILRKAPEDAAIENSKQSERKIYCYCCHICGRQFSRHSNLQRHIEIHQGEGAMYKCAICSCSYHYVSSLTRHVVTCHVDTTNKRSQMTGQMKKQESYIKSNSQFLQEDQVVEMTRFEDMSAENLQYVTGTIGHVTDGLNIEEGMEVLRIPVDEECIVIED